MPTVASWLANGPQRWRRARIPAPGEKTWLIADVLAYHVVLLGYICFC